MTTSTIRKKDDRLFDILNLIFLTVVGLTVLYPLYFVVIASFSNPDAVNSGEMWLFPKDITFEGYNRIFQDSRIWIGYLNTVKYTLVGTLVNVLLTVMGAYALSRKDLYGRNVVMLFFIFTMFFSGGLIPTYLLVKDLGMLNSMWALILPKAVALFNLIVTRTFFQTTLPDELLEAAKMDGCSDFRFFFNFALPLSKPIIAVIGLYYGVSHWNSYFDALIYLNREAAYPLQLILRNILIQSQISAQMLGGGIEGLAAQQRIAELIKYGVIIVASFPLLIVYPFLQRYFVQGVMIGSVKG
ncbi:putative aldouronate transport system permease protein [Paenibacillus sp. V4I3]|uniref:carbohydrate ABC transporter permease n=1 Tax=Paenibacillus sp. V4I3 TaxID=3042305 RepID=UPI002780A3B2|nr:carbohydrate ABC transporter permease [Paenibacillus sp. V4I3]MDQ0876539.1 putative aldouronate transport system permease protein [Paenibacillus sp. V4I3]